MDASQERAGCTMTAQRTPPRCHVQLRGAAHATVALRAQLVSLRKEPSCVTSPKPGAVHYGARSIVSMLCTDVGHCQVPP